jgi:MoxR-like ATPase
VPLTPGQLRTYTALAKQHEPKVPQELTDYVAAVYAELRRQEAMSDRPHSYTTPRTLLSILRLSQALAKLRFDNNVRPPAFEGCLGCKVEGWAWCRGKGVAPQRPKASTHYLAQGCADKS